MKDDTYEVFTIKTVTPGDDGFSVEYEDGWALYIKNPNGLPLPSPGDVSKQYGRGIGHPVRGFEANGVVYYYETEAEYRERCAREKEAADARKRVEFDENIRAFNDRIKALPASLQKRIERFMQKEDWGWNFGGYELFVCEEAVALNKAFPSRDLLVRFGKLSYEEQEKAFPEMSEGHSGNTFGASCAMAAALADCDEATIVKMHGALCPLVGCPEYGCWAATREASNAAD